MPKFCPRCNGKKPTLPDSPYCLRHKRDFRKFCCWPLLKGLSEEDRRFIYEHVLVMNRRMGQPSRCALSALADHLEISSSDLAEELAITEKQQHGVHIPLMVMVRLIIEHRT